MAAPPLEGLDDLALRVERLHVEEGVELDALLGQDRRHHLRHRFDGECPPDRGAEVDLGLGPDAALAHLGFDQEGDLQRGRWALVRHAGDGDHDSAPGEVIQCVPQSERAGRCRSDGPRCKVRDLVRRDPRSGGEDEVVVAERPTIGQAHAPFQLVHAGDLADHQLHPLVEQGRSGRWSLSAFSPPMAMYMKPGW